MAGLTRWKYVFGSISQIGQAHFPEQLIQLRQFTSTSSLERYRLLEEYPKGIDGVEKPDLVEKFLSAECMSAKESRNLKLHERIREFQRFDGDTGSSEVQVAVLTEKISQLSEHMKVHRKDFGSRRGLEAMLSQRRVLLQYMRQRNFDMYAIVLNRLGLKDNYAKKDRLMNVTRRH